MSSPGVRFPPPVLFVAGLALGAALGRAGPAFTLARSGSAWPVAAGWGLIVAGALLALWGVLTFRRAQTAILPQRPASRIVESGPYRFTRNPMYSGMTLAYLGATLLMNTLWPLLLLPAVLALLVRFVIRREEAYLEQAFADDYRRYRTRVRRWL